MEQSCGFLNINLLEWDRYWRLVDTEDLRVRFKFKLVWSLTLSYWNGTGVLSIKNKVPKIWSNVSSTISWSVWSCWILQNCLEMLLLHLKTVIFRPGLLGRRVFHQHEIKQSLKFTRPANIYVQVRCSRGLKAPLTDYPNWSDPLEALHTSGIIALHVNPYWCCNAT